MKQNFKDFLSYNKRERNGIIVLLVIIICLLGYLSYEPESQEIEDKNLQEFAEQIQKSNQERENIEAIYEDDAININQKGPPPINQTIVLKDFDPNIISDEVWSGMGLKKWQIGGIRKYMKKAGKFRSKEDFKKLRVIPENLYQKLEPFIKIKGSISEHDEDSKLSSKAKDLESKQGIELNTATIKELQSLKGIGPVLSGRIVKYREWLGGFYKKDQLLEVYGIKDSLYQKIEGQIELDQIKLNQININKVMTDVLKKHPYIKWRIANGIVNYRDQHGPYKEVSEIKNTDLVNDELYRKIAPYFSLK